MTNKLLLPPGPIARRLEGVIVCFSGVTCFLVYKLIKFDLCNSRDCSQLVVTDFFARLPELYLLYGVASILTGIFLYMDKEISRLFRFGIEMSVLTGTMLSGMIAFGMLGELGRMS